MIKIKLSTPFPEWPLLRQTSGSNGVWGNYKFYLNSDIDECDYWVVYDGLSEPEKTICQRKNTILITGEPPCIKRYNPDFLKQFGTIITSHKNLDHPKVVNMQQGLPWHVGRRVKGNTNISFSKDYDTLKAITNFEKSAIISVISSDKAMTDGHKKRLNFVKKLKEHFGTRLDVFGRGVRDIEDKWDAIANYKYHIVLENSSYPDYWTEKLADAFLGGAYPFYNGCPNLSDYFPQNSYTTIDIDDFENCVSIIEDTIIEQRYEKSMENIAKARNLILDKYNLFPLICNYCNSMVSKPSQQRIILYPEGKFMNIRSILNDMIKKTKQILFKNDMEFRYK
jgi:hypothetical protein